MKTIGMLLYLGLLAMAGYGSGVWAQAEASMAYQKLQQQAYAAADKEQYKEAAQLLVKALDAYDGDANQDYLAMKLNLAMMYQRAGDTERAQQVLLDFTQEAETSDDPGRLRIVPEQP